MRRVKISTGTGDLLRGVASLLVDRYVEGDERKLKAIALVDGIATSFEEGIGIEIQVGSPRRRLQTSAQRRR